MEHRAPLSGHRPRPPQRAVSGGSHGLLQAASGRPTLPSALSHIRSVSQPVNFVDWTSDATLGDKSIAATFIGGNEAVVTSPDVIQLEDDDGEPPAKRAKVSGADFKAEANEGDADVDDWTQRIAPGSPLPSLPKARSSASQINGHRSERFNIEPALRKAHALDPPTIATRVPPPKKAADFSPWTGNHPEDVLNENVVKSGFFDKVQGASQAESNSAKAAISSSLGQKNSHGLTLLGYLFTAVLEKRQVLGKFTVPSAFKPPPRATVTETKREAWLRDLANPDVPLRKQSRTIPHGIRGKLLMEQCLAKDIPLQRAVWLAKCVGANELRAFRRKGVSGSTAATGESKWVREWTVHVEQFLEDVIAACGEEGWQQKMNYAVKLSTTFFSETLLDTDHYLDWIVSSFVDASTDCLPIWIVLAQVYWKHITKYSRRGRAFAQGILEHLHNITQANLDVNALLRTRLQQLVAVLAVSDRGCLVIPKNWERYKYLLTPESSSGATGTPVKNIAKRNERLTRLVSKTAANIRSPMLDLYKELDSVGLDMSAEKLANKSLALIPDLTNLVSALFNWASTQYLVGLSRVYIAARIIAHLHNNSYDSDSAILLYLSDIQSPSATNIDHIHRVIVELMRLQAFSTSRYLQWLITSGASSHRGTSSCATKLITALAPSDLPISARNTRNTLMRRLGYSLEESTMIDGVLSSIDEAIARSASEHIESIHFPGGLTLSAAFSISQQTCLKLGDMLKSSEASLGAFGVARDVIESAADIHSLSALVTAATTTDNSALLATVVDTVNLHAESFAALENLDGLINGLTERYMQLRSQQPLDRTWILALTSLTQRIPGKASFVKLLANDLAICEQQSSLAVCSPASDSVIGMHASSLDSDDDIDAVFASGNTMDEQLMQRVFNRIMSRASKPMPPGPEPTSHISAWLNQLRSVDTGGSFESLVHSHVRGILNGDAGNTSSMDHIVYLVASGCLTLDEVATIAKDISSPQMALEILSLFVSTTKAAVGLHEAERYRYRLQQSRCRDEHVEDVSSIVRAACQAADLTSVLPDLVTFIIWCSSSRPDIASRIFDTANGTDVFRANIKGLLTTLLSVEYARDNLRSDMDMRSVVHLANPLSIQFATEALRCFQNGVPQDASNDRDVLADAVLESFTQHSDVWPQLLEVSGETVNEKLHKWAEDQLFSMVTGPSVPCDDARREHAKRCLNLLAFTSTFTADDEDTAIFVTITDSLKEQEKELSEFVQFDAESHDRFSNLMARVWITLDLCTIHVHELPNDQESTKRDRSTLLAALSALLIHPRLQAHQDVIEYLFDLSSTLADNLPEAALMALQKQSSLKMLSDLRLKSIFGTTSESYDSWLVLASHMPPPGSQQQRALNRHASQQLLQSGQLTAPGQTQSTFPLQHQRVSSQGGLRQDTKTLGEMKTTPFPLRVWEIMPEVMGENNTSLDLKLFGARKM